LLSCGFGSANRPFYSSSSYYQNANGIFPVADSCVNPIKGVMRCLLDSQFPVDILLEHLLEERAKEYPLIVLPEWDSIGGTAKKGTRSLYKSWRLPP